MIRRPAIETAHSPDIASLNAVFLRQRSAFSQASVPSVAERRTQIQHFMRVLQEAEQDIVRAVSDDFGTRVPMETLISEVGLTIGAARYLHDRLPRLAKQRGNTNPLSTIPGRTYLQPKPKGVVGIMAPWNYPLQLALVPAIAAYAAGNRVMIKPSELSPRTGELLTILMAKVFDETQMSVILGELDVAQAFAALPFDHLFFTGSTGVGRKIALAAAENLTPITLELGGKSPCVVMPDADAKRSADMIAMGKMFNGGQSCVAPDYVLCPKARVLEFADAIADAMRTQYADGLYGDGYTSIASASHFDRLVRLREDAVAQNAKLVLPFGAEKEDKATRKFSPTLLIDPDPSLLAMREEIFGPILPIIAYNHEDEAIAFINQRDNPLALYVFGENMKAARRVIRETLAGSAAINATVFHYAVEHLPFGGIGASGQGAYHGDQGFLTFSHIEPVLEFPKLQALINTVIPPYGKVIDFITKRTIGK